MTTLAGHGTSYPSHTRVRVTERLLIAGLRAQERADESEAARRRLAFLFKASQRLAQSLEPAAVVDALLGLLVPELADAASLHTVPSGNGVAQTTWTTSPALSDEPPEWWNRIERVTRPAVARAIGPGVSESASELAGKSRSHSLAGPLVSFIVVSLRARGQTL